MGSARVQYELERTLPSLQLAATHGLFSKDLELRDITQKRRQFENALVRRHALVGDYLRYIHYEEDLEKLRVLRVTRLKDLNKIPGQDMIKMQKEAISHIVSIFERGVKRLRYDLDLWVYYIKWAHKKKMRTAVSRVSARALALFPNKVNLWLLVADHELNDYQGASTSRALLQRGLRLNSISHPWSIRMQAEDRPKKRVKRSERDQRESSKELRIIQSGNKEEDEATLILTDAEQDLIRIWIQYVRMELVFIERLRRRRIVLGISEENDLQVEDKDEEADEEVGAEQIPINNDGELAPPSLKSMKQDITTTQPSDALLQGAIPKAALKSAISLQSPSSLPPRAHFALLIAMADLVREFPFCDDKAGLRSGLLREIDEAIQARFPVDSAAMLLVSTSSMLDVTTKSPLTIISDVELKEELQEGQLLSSASTLAPGSFNKVAEKIFEGAHKIARDCIKEEESVSFLYVLSIINKSFNKVKQTTQVAADMRAILDSIRDRTLVLESPSALHFASQLRLIRFFQEMIESKDLGDALNQYLQACHKRVMQDAKKLQCNGLELERELCRGRYREVLSASKADVTKVKAINLAETIWKACERYPEDELLLQLYAQSLVEILNHGVLGQEEGLKCWLRIQQYGVGKRSARVWKIWLDWILTHKDKKLTTAQLESSISKTMGTPEAHEIIIKGYVSIVSHSSQKLHDRIAYIEKKAYPQPSFWRWMIAETKKWNLNNEERTKLVKLLHSKLIQMANIDVEDNITYLRFLILELDESALGLEVFKTAQSRLNKDPSKKITLEKAWQEMCQSLRERQEEQEQTREIVLESESV